MPHPTPHPVEARRVHPMPHPTPHPVEARRAHPMTHPTPDPVEARRAHPMPHSTPDREAEVPSLRGVRSSRPVESLGTQRPETRRSSGGCRGRRSLPGWSPGRARGLGRQTARAPAADPPKKATPAPREPPEKSPECPRRTVQTDPVGFRDVWPGPGRSRSHRPAATAAAFRFRPPAAPPREPPGPSDRPWPKTKSRCRRPCAGPKE